MAKTIYSDLSKELRQGIAPIYIVVGQESLLTERAVLEIQKATLGDEKNGFSYSEVDAQSLPEGFSLGKILTSLKAPSLMGGRRMLVIWRADVFFGTSRGKEAEGTLQTYFEAPSRNNVLVLTIEKWSGRIPSTVMLVDCAPPRRNQLSRWLVAESKRSFGKTLDRQAAELLIDCAGEHLQTLVQELEKLSLFVADRRRITSKDVETLVGRSREIDAFELCSAIAQRQAQRALELYYRMTEGATASDIVALIPAVAWQFRSLLGMRRLCDAGVPMQRRMEILNIRGKNKEKRAERMEKEARRFSSAELAEIYRKLLDLDVALKSSALPARQCFEHFLLETCVRQGPARAIRQHR